jgi:putative nucleotidyltransferase-like protein
MNDRLGDRGDRPPSALVALSSLVEEDGVLAAKELLDARDQALRLDALYPGLLHHKTLTNAIHHLEQAGGDLSELSVSGRLYRSLWPLNVLMPVPEESAGGRISLASIREGLDRHRELLHRMIDDFVGLGLGRPFVLIFGRSIEAAYPAYRHRMDYDTDMFVPTLDDGLAIVSAVLSRLGFVLSRCKVSRVEGPGLAVFNTFRVRRRHELHLDVMAGGYLTRAGLRPLWLQVPMAERSREVGWRGRTLQVPSAEDMLLITAAKPYRRREITRRDMNDAHFLLVAEQGKLDWDYVVRTAKRHQIEGALHLLMEEAERLENRSLVPADVVEELVPSPIEARLLLRAAAAEGLQRTVRTAEGTMLRPGRHRWSSLWPALWTLRFARARLGRLGAVAYLLAERFERAVFRLQFRAARRRGPLRAVVPLLRAMRPRFGSLCELREAPPPANLGFCLARTSARRPHLPEGLGTEERQALGRIIHALPDKVVEERIATTERATQQFEAHRCGAFLFNFGRIHRPL